MHKLLTGVPLIESPFFSHLLNEENCDEGTLRIARDLAERGFAVLDFPDAEISNLAESIKNQLDSMFDWESWKKHQAGLRIQDAWKFNDAVRQIASNEKMIELLSKLFGRKAFPFQTLNFPVGTQQHFHTDSIHFSSIPERFMCGVWVALEDVTMDSGPLEYFPGSHKWPIYGNEHIGVNASNLEQQSTQEVFHDLWQALIKVSGMKPEFFLPKKGQAIIWLSNLLHGGSKQADFNKTRWSQVTHYYFENCIYYTPMHSDLAIGNIDFRRMTNIISGEEVQNMYQGSPVSTSFIQFAKSNNRIAQQRSAAQQVGTSSKKIDTIKRKLNKLFQI